MRIHEEFKVTINCVVTSSLGEDLPLRVGDTGIFLELTDFKITQEDYLIFMLRIKETYPEQLKDISKYGYNRYSRNGPMYLGIAHKYKIGLATYADNPLRIYELIEPSASSASSTSTKGDSNENT